MAVIPARYSSTRFPGKPLTPLLGTPMVAHVVARVREAGCCDDVIVATDHERIAVVAREAGATVVMTGEARSGSDRVAMAIERIDAGIVINVQGDEPALPAANVRSIAAFLRSNPDVPMATLSLPAREGDAADPNTVKVVCDARGRALYFSRSPIPFQRTRGSGPMLRHVGLYGFQREALFRFTRLGECDLERAESLEQLRALYHGMAIQVLPAAGESVAVDRPEDVGRAEAAIAALASASEADRR